MSKYYNNPEAVIGLFQEELNFTLTQIDSVIDEYAYSKAYMYTAYNKVITITLYEDCGFYSIYFKVNKIIFYNNQSYDIEWLVDQLKKVITILYTNIVEIAVFSKSVLDKYKDYE